METHLFSTGSRSTKSFDLPKSRNLSDEDNADALATTLTLVDLHVSETFFREDGSSRCGSGGTDKANIARTDR